MRRRQGDDAGVTGHVRRAADRVLGIELPPFDPLNLRAAELRAGGHHVISLGQALPFFPPPASALDAARSALGHPDVHRYSTDPGLPSLRAALAERLAHDAGTPITPADLVITAGANHAFTLALATLVDPGDEVLLPSPYFTNHQMAIRALGAEAVEAPVADRETFAVRWSDIEPRLTPQTTAVVLCTPSNPTGATLDASEGARIVAELRRREIVVISDETYNGFVYEGEAWSAAAAPGWRENTVVLGTFSKAFGMMGWRVGYLLADADICEQAVKVQDAMIICAPVVSQMAVEGAVRRDWSYSRGFHDDFRERRRIVRDGIARIPALAWTPTRAGLFAFARVAACRDSAALSHELLERAHVVTIPGAAFGSAGEGFVRLSYGYASHDDLREAMARLHDFFT
jgi:aspartate/methionine/tyrosine aminotransferase